MKQNGRVVSLLEERVLDRLADLLLDADEILEILRTANSEQLRWVEPRVQKILNDIDETMKKWP